MAPAGLVKRQLGERWDHSPWPSPTRLTGGDTKQRCRAGASLAGRVQGLSSCALLHHRKRGAPKLPPPHPERGGPSKRSPRGAAARSILSRAPGNRPIPNPMLQQPWPPLGTAGPRSFLCSVTPEKVASSGVLLVTPTE